MFSEAIARAFHNAAFHTVLKQGIQMRIAQSRTTDSIETHTISAAVFTILIPRFG